MEKLPPSGPALPSIFVALCIPKLQELVGGKYKTATKGKFKVYLTLNILTS